MSIEGVSPCAYRQLTHDNFASMLADRPLACGIIRACGNNACDGGAIVRPNLHDPKDSPGTAVPAEADGTPRDFCAENHIDNSPAMIRGVLEEIIPRDRTKHSLRLGSEVLRRSCLAVDMATNPVGYRVNIPYGCDICPGTVSQSGAPDQASPTPPAVLPAGACNFL